MTLTASKEQKITASLVVTFAHKP